jgi:hypothetical protein
MKHGNSFCHPSLREVLNEIVLCSASPNKGPESVSEVTVAYLVTSNVTIRQNV